MAKLGKFLHGLKTDFPKEYNAVINRKSSRARFPLVRSSPSNIRRWRHDDVTKTKSSPFDHPPLLGPVPISSSLSEQHPSLTSRWRHEHWVLAVRQSWTPSSLRHCLFVNMTARRDIDGDDEFLLLATFILAAGSEDEPARKRRWVWSRQQLTEKSLRGEHKVLMEMEKIADQASIHGAWMNEPSRLRRTFGASRASHCEADHHVQGCCWCTCAPWNNTEVCWYILVTTILGKYLLNLKPNPAPLPSLNLYPYPNHYPNPTQAPWNPHTICCWGTRPANAAQSG